jgi:hypothetical protein
VNALNQGSHGQVPSGALKADRERWQEETRKLILKVVAAGVGRSG